MSLLFLSHLPDTEYTALFDKAVALCRVKKLKSTPIYVKPQLTSHAGTCRISVMVGIRNDPGKTIDSIILQFQLPPCILSADLTSNHGTVNVLSNKVLIWNHLHTLAAAGLP